MNSYIMVFELKPEFIDNYRRMHNTCHLAEYKDMLDAIKSSGCKEMKTFLFKNYSILYVECDDEIDVMFSKLGKTDANIKWQKVTDPWFAEPSVDESQGESNPVEKIFDLQQQLNGELKQY